MKKKPIRNSYTVSCTENEIDNREILLSIVKKDVAGGWGVESILGHWEPLLSGHKPKRNVVNRTLATHLMTALWDAGIRPYNYKKESDELNYEGKCEQVRDMVTDTLIDKAKLSEYVSKSCINLKCAIQAVESYYEKEDLPIPSLTKMLLVFSRDTLQEVDSILRKSHIELEKIYQEIGVSKP